MDIANKRTSNRGRLLALVAPGLMALEAAPAPWMVAGTSDEFQLRQPRLARSVPGCSPAHIGRLVQAEPAGEDHFSTKARSIT